MTQLFCKVWTDIGILVGAMMKLLGGFCASIGWPGMNVSSAFSTKAQLLNSHRNMGN